MTPEKPKRSNWVALAFNRGHNSTRRIAEEREREREKKIENRDGREKKKFFGRSGRKAVGEKGGPAGEGWSGGSVAPGEKKS